MKIIKKIYLTFFVVFSIISCSGHKRQSNECKVDAFSGHYLFEYSNNFTVLDDMVIRDPVVINYDKLNGDSYNKVFFVSPTLTLLQDSIFLKCSKKVKVKVDNILYKDIRSDMDYLYDTNTKHVTFNESYVFKKFYLEFEAIFIGNRDMNFIRNDSIIEKNISTYLVIEFKEKRAVKY